MKGREAERLEDALQRAERGVAVEADLAPLVEVARRAKDLTGPVPAPPRQLLPGRQRFLAEAVRLQAAGRRRGPAFSAVPRLVPAMIALIGVLGLLFGTGTLVAASVPGQPLYGLKLAAEEFRVALTSDPVASAALHRGLAKERLDEITALLEQGRAVDKRTTDRAQKQLDAALEAAFQAGEPDVGPALQGLEEMLEQRQRTMTASMAGWPEPARATVRQLVREMERVRQEAHAGQGDPDGAQERRRQGTPPEATDFPEPTQTPLRTGMPGTPGPTDGAGPEPSRTPLRTGMPGTPGPTEGVGPEPSQTPLRTGMPGTPGPTQGVGPEPSQTPLRTGMPGTPGPTQGVGPEPSHTPQPTEGMGPHPTDPPGPGASATPYSGPGDAPGPQATPMPSPGDGDGGGRGHP